MDSESQNAIAWLETEYIKFEKHVITVNKVWSIQGSTRIQNAMTKMTDTPYWKTFSQNECRHGIASIEPSRTLQSPWVMRWEAHGFCDYSNHCDCIKCWKHEVL